MFIISIIITLLWLHNLGAALISYKIYHASWLLLSMPHFRNPQTSTPYVISDSHTISQTLSNVCTFMLGIANRNLLIAKSAYYPFHLANVFCALTPPVFSNVAPN